MSERSPLVRHAEAVVIGAGLSGLAVAAALGRHRIPHLVLEREGAAGSTWEKRHPQLRLNTHRWLSQLPGMGYPAGTAAFPHRDDVVRYLAAYAGKLDSPIEFRTAVQSVATIGSHWLLQTNRGLRLARHVVVATGRDRIPWVPPWPGLGSYRGEFLHAAEFGDAARYAGRTVLVIGGGNSGIDILNHLSRVQTGPLWLSVRTPPAILPSKVAGVPLQPLTGISGRLPVASQDFALRLTRWLFYRDLARAGLPSPRQGGARRLHQEGVVPAIDDGFAAALRQGRVRVLPQPVAFDEQGVRFADGSTLQPDVVIAATGYRPGLEPLLGHLSVLRADGLPHAACGTPHPAHPGLWFVGMRPSPAGYFQAARDAASRIAKGIRDGRWAAPFDTLAKA